MNGQLTWKDLFRNNNRLSGRQGKKLRCESTDVKRKKAVSSTLKPVTCAAFLAAGRIKSGFYAVEMKKHNDVSVHHCVS